MNTPFADYLSPVDRELEIFRLSSEALDRQVALMESAADEMLEIAYLHAESAVLENHGDYNMLSDFYMEAQKEAEEKKKGAISSILDWIGRQFAKLSEWLTKVFGTKNSSRVDPNGKYNVHKDSFALFNVLKTAGSKFIEAVNNLIDQVITNKKITFAILATSVVSTISNVRLRKLVMACLPVDENGNTISNNNEENLDADNSTEPVTGDQVMEATQGGIAFLNSINKLCGKINDYLAGKNLDATNAQAAAKKNKEEKKAAKQQNQTTNTSGQTVEAQPEKVKESVDIEHSLFDAIRYFNEESTNNNNNTSNNNSTQTDQEKQENSGQNTTQNTGNNQQTQQTQNNTQTNQKTQKEPTKNDQAKQVAKDNNFTISDEVQKNLRMVASILKDLFKLVQNAFIKLGKAMPWVKQETSANVNKNNVTGEESDDEEEGTATTTTQQPTQPTNTQQPAQNGETPTDTEESAALFTYLDGEEEANLIEEGVPEEVLDTLDRLFEEM